MAAWSVVNNSLVNHHSGRIDAEYYKTESLQAYDYVKKGNYKLLGQLAKEGYRVVYENTKILKPEKVDEQRDVRFLQATNVSDDGLWIEPKEIGFVSGKDWVKYPKGRIKHGELLIEVKGQAEKVTIVQDYMPMRTLVTGTLYKLTVDEKMVSPEYIFAYFSCKYGKILRDRTKVNTLISYVSKPELYNIPIPIFEESIDEITNVVKESYRLSAFSHTLYHQAETLLAQELQLDKLKLPNKKWYTADYCEVVNEKRMNAEFFSPDVYSILGQDFLKEGATINDVFEIIRGYTPKCYYQSGVPMVKTKNVRTPNIDKKRISDYADSQESLTLTKKNDLILAAMGVGSLGRMSYVTEEETNCAIDGTLRILRKKDLSMNDMEIPTMLFLSTEVGQKLIYRGISGTTGIISLPDDYLERIPIPVFEKSVRRKVTELVLNSIKAKNQSEQLLAQAKHRVEELIEQEANKYK